MTPTPPHCNITNLQLAKIHHEEARSLAERGEMFLAYDRERMAYDKLLAGLPEDAPATPDTPVEEDGS